MGDEDKNVGPIYGQQPSQYNNDSQVEGTYKNFGKQTTIPQNTNTPVPEAPAPETQTVTSPRFSNLGDVNDFLNERVKYYKSLQETDEEKKKRERREKRQRIMANIGDILGSMHKAYSHARGVQPMQIENISERMQARFDKAKAARDANEERLYGYLSQQQSMENQQRQMEMQEKSFELKQKQEERAANKEERETNLTNARIGLINAQTAKNEEMTAYYTAKIKYLSEGMPLEIAEKQANIDAKRAMEAKYRHDANRPYSTYGGNSDEYETVTEIEKEDPVWGKSTEKRTTTKKKKGRSGSSSKSSKKSSGNWAAGLSLK